MDKYRYISAIVLAGGKSTRMNGEKALLPVFGVKIIEKIIHNLEQYFAEIIISARSKEMFDFLPHRVVVDEHLGCGPLMGILSGLRVSTSTINFVIACDIPDVNIHFLEKMISFTGNYDIVVPTSGKDKFEPLFAFYNKNLIPIIEDLLHDDTRQINRLFSKCRTKYVPMENDGWYHNLNTLEDYQEYLKTEKKS